MLKWQSFLLLDDSSMKRKLTKNKKIYIGILAPFTAMFLVFSILCIVTMCLYSSTFLSRVLTHWDSSVTDYQIFPQSLIEKSENPYVYQKDIQFSLDNMMIHSSKKQISLSKFIEQSDTTSFIMVQNDQIIYEKYANGYDENSIYTSFSMAKSVVSLLIGKAVEEKYIASITQPISDYIEEFRNLEIGKTTIEDLLLMRSNIVYNEDKFLWFGDDSLTYWSPDLRKLSLSHRAVTDAYQGKFHYNNYHPLLLGIILERSTGVSVSTYFEQKIWQKIGAEYAASWSLDSEKSHFEKMESGINFCATDFLKIGSMVLHDGYWNETQIIHKDWLDRSTLCEFPLDTKEYENSFLEGKNIGYQYSWYSTPSDSSNYDRFAWGKSDQILYISPIHNLVILRTGKTDGGISNWIDVIKEIIETMK